MKTIPLLIICFMLSALANAQVPYQRIANAEPGDWLTYSGNYQAHRFSPLNQITPDNVAKLKVTWLYQAQEKGYLETSPLVADGVMYLTEPGARVTALDLRTGRKLWSWQRPQSAKAKTIGFGATNRGVAILDNTVYVGTLDCPSLRWMRGRARCGGKPKCRTTSWVMRSLLRRWPWTAKSSSASAAAKRAFAAFWMLMTPRPASWRGAVSPFPRRANRATKPGKAMPGNGAAARRG